MTSSTTNRGAATPPHATFRRVRRASSGLKWLLHELREDRLATIGAVIVVVLLVSALAAPLIAPYEPALQSLEDRLMPPVWQSGDWSHPLGTDNLGRDVLSRLIFGSRASLLVGFLVVLISGAFGVAAGLIAGYFGGRTESVIMRLVDTQMAFPGLLLALIVLTVLGPSTVTIVVVLALNGWMVYASVARGVVLSVKEKPFVEAAEILGCRPLRVIVRHILPNLLPVVMVLGILELARVVLTEAALSFLGVGIQPPGTSWGLDVAIGQDYIFSAWWLVTFPGLAIAATVLSVNLVASWLQVLVNPQQREKRFAASLLGRRGA